MEEKAKKELDTLKGMLHNWKDGFMSWAEPDGDNEHVVEEFIEDIGSNLFPYVKRLVATNYLSESEAKEFMDYCHGQVDDLRHQLSKTESKKEV